MVIHFKGLGEFFDYLSSKPKILRLEGSIVLTAFQSSGAGRPNLVALGC